MITKRLKLGSYVHEADSWPIYLKAKPLSPLLRVRHVTSVTLSPPLTSDVPAL